MHVSRISSTHMQVVRNVLKLLGMSNERVSQFQQNTNTNTKNYVYSFEQFTLSI
jgi:hypothetical protein